jgi:hypothetical protein
MVSSTFVNHPHAAAAKFFDHAVVRDGLTEQKGEALRPRSNMLGVRKGQVNGTRSFAVFAARRTDCVVESKTVTPEKFGRLVGGARKVSLRGVSWPGAQRFVSTGGRARR